MIRGDWPYGVDGGCYDPSPMTYTNLVNASFTQVVPSIWHFQRVFYPIVKRFADRRHACVRATVSSPPAYTDALTKCATYGLRRSCLRGHASLQRRQEPRRLETVDASRRS